MNDESSVLLSLFGNSPHMKIIDYLLEFPNNEFTTGELVEAIGMSKTTVPKILELLVEQGLILKTEKIGKSQPYKINLKDQIIKLIQNAVFMTSDKIADRQMASRRVRTIARKSTRNRESLVGRRDLLNQELEYTERKLNAIPAN